MSIDFRAGLGAIGVSAFGLLSPWAHAASVTIGPQGGAQGAGVFLEEDVPDDGSGNGSALYPVAFPSAETRSLTTDIGTAAVSYELQELGDGARFDVTTSITPTDAARGQARLDFNFTITEGFNYAFEAAVPSLFDDSTVQVGLLGSEDFVLASVQQANGETFPGNWPAIFDGQGNATSLLPLTSSGFLPAGTYRFVLTLELLGSEVLNETYAASASLVLSRDDANPVIPTPAAAGAGLALLAGLAAKRRRGA